MGGHPMHDSGWIYKAHVASVIGTEVAPTDLC
jgi:hypothetical protein